MATVLRNFGPAGLRVAGPELKCRPQNQVPFGKWRVTVGKIQRLAWQRHDVPIAGDIHRDDDIGNFIAMRAGVHLHGATNAARNRRQPFDPGQSPVGTLVDEPGQAVTGRRFDLTALKHHGRFELPQADGNAVERPIRHQEIGAVAQRTPAQTVFFQPGHQGGRFFRRVGKSHTGDFPTRAQ